MEVNGRRFEVEGKLIRIASLEDEWFEDVSDPEALIGELKRTPNCPDILSFWQRLPDAQPRFSYLMAPDPIAALPISSYSHWLEKQVNPSTRNKVRKAAKHGIMVRQTEFNDEFVRGMESIFNETPIRQERRYLHYGKDFETIKKQFSRFLFREEILGAYLGDELVGFIMLADADKYAVLGQIISKVSHRDKAPTNALLAKAVERSAERGFAHLVYAYWLEDALGDFKRNNGFQKVDLPRYYVPLTLKGRLALGCRLHRGWREMIPPVLKKVLKKIRSRWYQLSGAR